MSGRSPSRAWRAVYPASTWGHDGGSAEATKVSYEVECVRDVWVLTGNMAPLSWWFWGSLVLALASSRMFCSSVLEKITSGRAMALISPS